MNQIIHNTDLKPSFFFRVFTYDQLKELCSLYKIRAKCAGVTGTKRQLAHNLAGGRSSYNTRNTVQFLILIHIHTLTEVEVQPEP